MYYPNPNQMTHDPYNTYTTFYTPRLNKPILLRLMEAVNPKPIRQNISANTMGKTIPTKQYDNT